MSRINTLVLGAPLATSLALGTLIGLTVARPDTVPVAHAINCPANSSCQGENPNTKTSNIFVEHTYTSGVKFPPFSGQVAKMAQARDPEGQ
jgi:hypothetical protein